MVYQKTLRKIRDQTIVENFNEIVANAATCRFTHRFKKLAEVAYAAGLPNTEEYIRKEIVRSPLLAALLASQMAGRQNLTEKAFKEVVEDIKERKPHLFKSSIIRMATSGKNSRSLDASGRWTDTMSASNSLDFRWIAADGRHVFVFHKNTTGMGGSQNLTVDSVYNFCNIAKNSPMTNILFLVVLDGDYYLDKIDEIAAYNNSDKLQVLSSEELEEYLETQFNIG